MAIIRQDLVPHIPNEAGVHAQAYLSGVTFGPSRPQADEEKDLDDEVQEDEEEDDEEEDSDVDDDEDDFDDEDEEDDDAAEEQEATDAMNENGDQGGTS